jgi:alcohol-forming fatty acyl-CoA reductase
MTDPKPTGARVLLTGCTGFVGKVVLEELLRRRDELGVERVHLLIRPRAKRTARDRFQRDVAGSPCFRLLEPGWTDLCDPVAGDITRPGLGLDAADAARLHAEVTHIIHCAASVKFDLPLAEATRINITGALEVLSFAQGCTALRRLVDVSTAYVTPHPGNRTPVWEELVHLPYDAEEAYEGILAGRIEEAEMMGRTGHPNTYTLTKCLAESLLERRRGEVPLTLLRPSIVSACRRFPFPGWIDSRAAYAAFVSLLGAGYLRAIRFDPQVVADIVPCDDVADRIISCAFDPALQEPFVVRHAVVGVAGSGGVTNLARSHERYFQVHPHGRPARWAYMGSSPTAFRINAWLHQRVPLRAAGTVARLRGRRQDSVKISKLDNGMEYLDGAFSYFTHHTFDFRTAFPPLQDFDLATYLDAISAGVSEHLLKRDPRRAPVQMHGTDLAWALRQPEGNATVRAFGYVIRKAFRGARTRITFDETEIERALAQVGEDELVVVAPSHRSYLDFLLTSLLPFAHPGLGLRMPRKAAAEDFKKIPVLGRLLQSAGAFYIKRGLGAPDPALTDQICKLVRDGHSLEFYAEGKRSRSRRFLAPKRGLLRALQQSGRPAVVLPMSITYDRIAEEEGFLSELDGGGKHRGGLRPLTGWAVKLLRGEIELGSVHLRCGEPLRLDAQSDVQEVSLRLVAELQRHMAVTTFHIATFCHHNARFGIRPDALRRSIERRGGVVIESWLTGEEDVPALLQRTFECQWMHLFYADAMARMHDDDVVAAHVARNGFWFPPLPREEDPVASAVVEALFGPIVRDHKRVFRVVGEMPVGTGFDVHEMLRQVPGAFLRDVEDALDRLVEAGLLVSDGETFRRVRAAPAPLEFRPSRARRAAGP